MNDQTPMVLFSNLPAYWSATSMLVDTVPVTVLHRLNFEIDDPLDTTLTCATYRVNPTKQIDNLANIMQDRLEQKVLMLDAEYFTPHDEIGTIQKYSGIDFTIIGGTYSAEETGVLVETSYISIEEKEVGVDIIEIATVVPLQHVFTSDPEINHILKNMIVATR